MPAQSPVVSNSRPKTCNFVFEMFIYLERRGESARACALGRGQREREKERIPSRLHAVSTEPDVWLELMNHEISDLSQNQAWDA